jgi:hypothetical protein
MGARRCVQARAAGTGPSLAVGEDPAGVAGQRDAALAARLLPKSGAAATSAAPGSVVVTGQASPRAVERHVTAIFDKLKLPASPGLHRRVAAVLAHLRTA